MKSDCPVGDLKILWHLLQQVSVQQRLYAMGNTKKFEGIIFTILTFSIFTAS